MRTDVANPDKDVSLYLWLMSAAVTLIAVIASSRVTLKTPSDAIASCPAVIAFTASERHSISSLYSKK